MHLGELVIRLSGPVLFSAAFIAFLAQYDTTTEFMSTVKDRFLGGEVYSQSSLDADNEIFDFQPNGGYEVTGAYLQGILSADITEKTIVIGDNHDYYQKLVIYPPLLDNTMCYTVYKTSLSASAVNSLAPVFSDTWVAGQSFRLDYIVDYNANYTVDTHYSPTGGIVDITYTKKTGG